MRSKHGYAVKRINIIIAAERAHPLASARAAGLLSTVDRGRRQYRTPSAVILREVCEALTEYEAMRPAGGFADVGPRPDRRLYRRRDRGVRASAKGGAVMAAWPTDDPTGTHWSDRPDTEPIDEPYDAYSYYERRADLDAADAADLDHDEQASSDADPWEDIF